MTRALRQASPFDLVGKMRRTVEIESALHVTGSSYQVDWTETGVETGVSPKQQKMRALVTVKLLPVDAAAMRNNPLGIFIDNCEITSL
jgi:type IV secretory pathway TrbF-like protein